MFGKNKKDKTATKNKEPMVQPVIHTMQDDMDINLSEPSITEDAPKENLAKTESPFSGGDSKKSDISPSSTAQSLDMNSAAPKAPVAPKASEDSPFSGGAAPDTLKTQAINTKPEINETPAPKKEAAPVMPKSVDDLTTAVDKEEGSAYEAKKSITDNAEDLSKKIEEDSDSDKSAIEMPEEKKKSNAFVYAAIIFLIVVIGVAGYFIWNSKYNDIDIAAENDSNQPNIFTEEPEIIIDDSGEEEESVENVPETPQFSEKVNFLVIESANLDENGIKNAISQKFLEMSSFEGNLLEFILVDESNNPISFSNFSTSFGLTLPGTVASQVSDDFSVYLYKNGNIEKMGIAIKASEGNTLMTSLKSSESSLVSGMSALLLESVMEDELSEEAFKDSDYNEIAIRFNNLNDMSSIDYAVVGDYLIFATSKDSGRSIIDKVLSEESEMEKAMIESDDTAETEEDVPEDTAPSVEGVETSASGKETKNIFNESQGSVDLGEGETMIEV